MIKQLTAPMIYGHICDVSLMKKWNIHPEINPTPILMDDEEVKEWNEDHPDGPYLTAPMKLPITFPDYPTQHGLLRRYHISGNSEMIEQRRFKQFLFIVNHMNLEITYRSIIQWLVRKDYGIIEYICDHLLLPADSTRAYHGDGFNNFVADGPIKSMLISAYVKKAEMTHIARGLPRYIDHNEKVKELALSIPRNWPFM
jgi:hypothetical protein